MEKITMDSFKDNKGLIFITILLAFLIAIGTATEPKYLSVEGAVVVFIVGVPLISLWYQAFWNRILRKIFPLPEISYGVAFLLSASITLFFG